MFSKKNDLSGEGRSDQSQKRTEQYTIVQLAGSGMKILLPDGYERLKRKNPVREVVSRAANTDAAFRKTEVKLGLAVIARGTGVVYYPFFRENRQSAGADTSIKGRG